MLTFTPVSVFFLSLSIVTEVQAVLPPEPTTREDFLQCEFDTNTFYTVYFITSQISVAITFSEWSYMFKQFNISLWLL